MVTYLGYTREGILELVSIGANNNVVFYLHICTVLGALYCQVLQGNEHGFKSGLAAFLLSW